MAELILHGGPRSNYVRACRLTLAEKGVDYTYDPVLPQTPEALARHPWGKIPALTHGDVALYETLAITYYIDETFDGPALRPADAAGRGRMNQWISNYNAYMDTPFVRHIVIQRLLRDPPDESMIADAVPAAAKCLEVLNDALADAPYLAGDSVSLADFFVLPPLNYLAMTPEGEQLLATTGNVTAWLDRMMLRDSAQAVLAA